MFLLLGCAHLCKLQGELARFQERRLPHCPRVLATQEPSTSTSAFHMDTYLIDHERILDSLAPEEGNSVAGMYAWTPWKCQSWRHIWCMMWNVPFHFGCGRDFLCPCTHFDVSLYCTNGVVKLDRSMVNLKSGTLNVLNPISLIMRGLPTPCWIAGH
jgi:hypothetical protein